MVSTIWIRCFISFLGYFSLFITVQAMEMKSETSSHQNAINRDPIPEIWSNYSCMGNMIIAGATGYSFREIRTFLLSYNISTTSKNSRLILLLEESQRSQSNLNEFIHSLYIPSISIRYITFPKDKTVIFNSFRYNWLRQYLHNELAINYRRYCNILSTDIRDVYFQSHDYFYEIEIYKASHDILHGLSNHQVKLLSQHRPRLKPIDELLSHDSESYRFPTSISTSMRGYIDTYSHEYHANYPIYLREKRQYLPRNDWIILSQEGIQGGKKLNTCIHHVNAASLSCMKVIIKDYNSLMERNIICSGSIVGSHMGIIKLLDKMIFNMNQVQSSCLTQPMTDQMILNIIIYEQYLPNQSKDIEVLVPDNYYSPMLTMGYIPEEFFDITHQKHIITRHSDLGVARIVVSRSHYRKNEERTYRPPAYVHQYDRFIDIIREINFGLGCGRGQYYGDKGEYMMSSAYQKKRKKEIQLLPDAT